MSNILSTTIVASLLFVFAAPAFAADAPKTKAECEKLTDMKWGFQDEDVREEVTLV